jgi:hypothetical protein
MEDRTDFSPEFPTNTNVDLVYSRSGLAGLVGLLFQRSSGACLAARFIGVASPIVPIIGLRIELETV